MAKTDTPRFTWSKGDIEIKQPPKRKRPTRSK